MVTSLDFLVVCVEDACKTWCSCKGLKCMDGCTTSGYYMQVVGANECQVVGANECQIKYSALLLVAFCPREPFSLAHIIWKSRPLAPARSSVCHLCFSVCSPEFGSTHFFICHSRSPPFKSFAHLWICHPTHSLSSEPTGGMPGCICWSNLVHCISYNYMRCSGPSEAMSTSQRSLARWTFAARSNGASTTTS